MTKQKSSRTHLGVLEHKRWECFCWQLEITGEQMTTGPCQFQRMSSCDKPDWIEPCPVIPIQVTTASPSLSGLIQGPIHNKI